VSATLDQRMIAATLAAPSGVIIGWFAARIHGLPVLVDLDQREVTMALPKERRSTVVSVRRSAAPLPSRPWETGRVADPTLTVVTLADGGALRWQLEAVLHAALTRRLVTVERIEALLQQPGWRRFGGRPMLVALLDERTGRLSALYRSQTERRVHRWLVSTGLPAGKASLLVSTPAGEVEVDVGWPSHRVALEISPFWTHGSRAKQERDVDRRQALVSEGWGVVEADDRHLKNRHAFEPILRLLTQLLARGS
jgi:hypothetical protein